MTFTVTLSAAATVDVTVNWTASIESGDTAEAADLGSMTTGPVRVTASQTTATGPVTVTAGQTTATFTVETAEDTLDEYNETFTVALSSPSSNATLATDATTATGTITDDDERPALSIADGSASEDSAVKFTVSLTPASGRTVTVGWGVGTSGTARAGSDYTAASGTVTIPAGGTSGTVRVTVLGDAHDEGEEKMVLVLYRADGAIRADYVAVGAIENSDEMPGAWLSRFGRTVTDQVLDVVEARLAAPRAAGARVRLAGQALLSWDGGGKTAAGDDASGDNASERGLRAEARDRDAMTAIRDWMAHAGATGDRRGDGPDDRVLMMTMGAAGMRGEVLTPPPEGVLALAVKGDARFTRTASEATKDANGGELAAATDDVWLLRLGVEGSRRFALGGDGAGMVLTPSFEVGARLDGGDAETGAGADVGAGVALAAPKHGLMLVLNARGLLAHEASGFRESGAGASFTWDPRPGTDRGLMLTLRQSWGGSPAGGMDALLGRETLAGLAANDNGDTTASAGRLEAELGYGIALFGGGFTGTPHLGVGLSESGRDYRLGWRLTSARRPRLRDRARGDAPRGRQRRCRARRHAAQRHPLVNVRPTLSAPGELEPVQPVKAQGHFTLRCEDGIDAPAVRRSISAA